jgi:exonuclease SbcC
MVSLVPVRASQPIVHGEGNEFQVIDHWNAEERRSVRTLSGGESFLASLALALGLSASVSQFSGGGSFNLVTLFPGRRLF